MKSITAIIATICVINAFAISQPATARQPNVVIILTDDQGWGDLGVSGNTNLATPNIDTLARDGATVQHFYVCQVCAPTRAEFLTGRYYPRTGVSGVSDVLQPNISTNADRIPDNFRDVVETVLSWTTLRTTRSRSSQQTRIDHFSVTSR